MAATAVTLNDLEGHSRVTVLFKCNPSNICAACYTISTDSVLLCSHGSSALAELLVIYVRAVKLVFSTVIYVVATKTLNFDPGPEHETDVLIVNFNGPHCGLSTNCATKNELIK